LYSREDFVKSVTEIVYSIVEAEEQMTKNSKFSDMTGNDMRVVAAIGIADAKNMSAIAKELSVTVGTLTISINSLLRKGYVLRERGIIDKRTVYISLSAKGKKAFLFRQRFFETILLKINGEFTVEQQSLLYNVLIRMNKILKDV
jgi:Transcriptional regulators